jgi:hypothetical protein
MPLCYCPRGFVLELVSSSRSKTIGEEEADKATIGGHEEEKDSKG